MGCGISISFVCGAECEIYLSCYNVFLQFLYYRVRDLRNLEKLVSMLYCRAHERSNNPYIELLVEPCLSKNQKEILAMWVWLERKFWKGLRQWKKVSLSWKQSLCEGVWEKKNSLETHVIILRYIRNLNLPFKKDFKFAEPFTKTLFFLYFRDHPKNGEWNKLRRRR